MGMMISKKRLAAKKALAQGKSSALSPPSLSAGEEVLDADITDSQLADVITRMAEASKDTVLVEDQEEPQPETAEPAPAEAVAAPASPKHNKRK